MSESNERHPFSADRPIKSASEDVLGRSHFAYAIAEAVKGWRQSDSLVIALQGPWGSGKSSLKNMVLESIESMDPSPSVLEFNPWEWASQNQVFSAFFDQVGIKLGRASSGKDGTRRAAHWRLYGARLRLSEVVAKGFRGLLLAVIPLFLALFGAASFFDTFRTISGIVLIVLAVLIALITWITQFSDAVANWIEVRAKALSKTLPELKEELSRDMATLPTPLVIVIDDVDRLQNEQIRSLFQLIKANADFPNLVYLLLFERERIVQALDSSPGGGGGAAFLEKIVQVSFDMPQVEDEQQTRVLTSALDELLSESGADEHFDQVRWGNLFHGGLSHFFKTLRDVRRFTSTFSFQLGLLQEENTLNVNAIDLIGLETLRVFEPRVYQLIGAAKPVLTNLLDREGLKDRHQAVVDEIIAAASDANKEAVKDVFKQLFPPAEWALGGTNYATSSYADDWHRELRACHPQVFDRYFLLRIPEGDMSEADMKRILQSVGNREILVEELRSLKERGSPHLSVGSWIVIPPQQR